MAATIPSGNGVAGAAPPKTPNGPSKLRPPTVNCAESPMESAEFDEELFDASDSIAFSEAAPNLNGNNEVDGASLRDFADRTEPDVAAPPSPTLPQKAPPHDPPPRQLHEEKRLPFLPKKFSFTATHAPQVPLVSSVQKIILYETKQRYYLIGTNNMESKYRVLEVDRTDHRELVIHDDGITYSQKEIKQMLQMIDVGNRSKQAAQRNVAGMTKTLSAFGVVGFVKFLEGYYMILITKRRKVALVGHHTIYKVEDVAMVYIPSESVRKHDSEEAKYVKMFQSVDLSSNFYFSYSYDLTHSLQYNMTKVSVSGTRKPGGRRGSFRRRTMSEESHTSNDSANESGADDDEDSLPSEFRRRCTTKSTASTATHRPPAPSSSASSAATVTPQASRQRLFTSSAPPRRSSKSSVVGIRTLPHYKFVWNEFLLENFETRVHSSWVLHIIHGFVSQGDLEVFGRSIFITLVARRSKKYAGTRFLKRGANGEGDVANEVETEQIVNLAEVQDWNRGSFTSFVQLRGSIPLCWSQDVRQIVPKPPINIDDMDPFCTVPGEHFNKLLKRFGSPIIVFNLIKKKERRVHESMLGGEFEKAIKYLNQFLSFHHRLEYIHFDMARVSRSRTAVVMDRLIEIADACVRKTGFFQNFPDMYCHTLRPEPAFKGVANGANDDQGRIQTGIVRTNCVDCLDRTNTAQFAIAKKALAYQLFSLGVLETPVLEFDSDAVRMLEGLFEDHGDTLALQYGGSQLVHRIRSYRRVSPWLQSKSNDFFQSVSRYYSNTFSDNDKQQAINLFLGVFQPKDFRLKVNLSYTSAWEFDYYLHHAGVRSGVPRNRFYTQWWDAEVWASLPRAYEEEAKDRDVMVAVECNNTDECVDSYREYYRPHELTSLDDLYCSNMINSMRDYTPSFAKNISPFAVRDPQEKNATPSTVDQPGFPSSSLKVISTGLPASTGTMNQRPVESVNDGRSAKGVNSSMDTSDESPGSDTDTDDDIDSLSDWGDSSSTKPITTVTMAQMFPSMKDVYGTVIHAPKANDVNLYKEFSTIGHNAGCGTAPIDRTRHRLIAKQRLSAPAGLDVLGSPNRGQPQPPPSKGKGRSSHPAPTAARVPSTPAGGGMSLMTADEMKQSTTVLIQRSVFSLDTSRRVMPPIVKRSNRDVYEQYVARANGPQDPSPASLKKYQEYVSLLYK